MNNTNKLLLIVALFVAGIMYTKVELSKHTSIDQLLKSDTQIVYFDGLDVFNKSEEVQATRKELEERFQKEGKNLQNLRAEAEKAASELQNMGSIVTKEARRNKQEEVLNKKNQVTIKERTLQEYAQQAMQSAEYAMAQKLKECATKVAEEKGYDIVLAGGVAYGKKGLCINNLIVTKWNNEWENTKKTKSA